MEEGAETDVGILLVEDNPGDVRLVEEALRETHSSLHVTRNGKEALEFLHRRNESTDASLPHIVLLDLNLPQVNGNRVLEEIQSDPGLENIRVIVLTSARKEHADLEWADLDAGDFLTKPTDPDEFMALVRSSIFG